MRFFRGFLTIVARTERGVFVGRRRFITLRNEANKGE